MDLFGLGSQAQYHNEMANFFHENGFYLSRGVQRALAHNVRSQTGVCLQTIIGGQPTVKITLSSQ
jgi:hypothetical protein